MPDGLEAPSTRLVGFLAMLPSAGAILELGRYYNYPTPDWLKATYAASGSWHETKSDTSVAKSFDEAPATMLHVVKRKA